MCIVARASEDGACDFGAAYGVADNGENALNNPTPVYDRVSGILWLFLNSSLKEGGEDEVLKGCAPRTVLISRSLDQGRTWSLPEDRTALLKRPDWGWYAFGPCHGVQLGSGRLILPCNHSLLSSDRTFDNRYISHTVYSDDHGVNWKIGGDVGEYTNECALAELPDGRLYMNMRSYHGKGCRAAAWSSDGGESWRDMRLEYVLPDPICQGSVIACAAFGLAAKPALFFSNAADSASRVRLSLRISRDGGLNWSGPLVLHEGPSAYSDLGILPDGRVCCVYECGERDPYERIELCTIDASEIERLE